MGAGLIQASHPDTHRPNERAPYADSAALWLFAAGALLLVADGRNTIALAAWLAPVCLLCFVRRQPPLRGLLIAYAGLAVTRAIAFRGMVPIPGVFYYIFAVISAVSALLPYIADRLLAARLTGLRGTLIFPCTLVSAQFVYSHGPDGSWGTMAYTQAGNLPLLQVLSVTGIWGITFLIGWFAAALNQALESPRRLLPLGVFTAVYLSVVIGGAARLAFFPPSAASVRIASLSPAQAQAPVQPGSGLFNAIAGGNATSVQMDEFRTASYTVQQDLLTRSAREAAAECEYASGSCVACESSSFSHWAAFARGSALLTRVGLPDELFMKILLRLATARSTWLGHLGTSSSFGGVKLAARGWMPIDVWEWRSLALPIDPTLLQTGT